MNKFKDFINDLSNINNDICEAEQSLSYYKKKRCEIIDSMKKIVLTPEEKLKCYIDDFPRIIGKKIKIDENNIYNIKFDNYIIKIENNNNNNNTLYILTNKFNKKKFCFEVDEKYSYSINKVYEDKQYNDFADNFPNYNFNELVFNPELTKLVQKANTLNDETKKRKEYEKCYLVYTINDINFCCLYYKHIFEKNVEYHHNAIWNIPEIIPSGISFCSPLNYTL